MAEDLHGHCAIEPDPRTHEGRERRGWHVDPDLPGIVLERLLESGVELLRRERLGGPQLGEDPAERLTEALAEELAGSSVTVNAVLPSIIDTPTNRKDMPDADFSEWVKPEAIAGVILFLASSASGAVTGGLIPVTRGG